MNNDGDLGKMSKRDTDRLWRQRAREVAWNGVPEGKLGDIVVLLRARARFAARRANLFLVLLVFTIALGFGYYIGVPVYLRINSADVNAANAAIDQYQDQLEVIDQQRKVIETEVDGFAALRSGSDISPFGGRSFTDALVARIEGIDHAVVVANGVPDIEIEQGLFIFPLGDVSGGQISDWWPFPDQGDDPIKLLTLMDGTEDSDFDIGTEKGLWRFDLSSGEFEELLTSAERDILDMDGPANESHAVAVGTDGWVARRNADGVWETVIDPDDTNSPNWQLSATGVAPYNAVLAIGDNHYLVVGNSGRALFSGNGGLQWTDLQTPLGGKAMALSYHEALDEILISGSEGRVYRTTLEQLRSADYLAETSWEQVGTAVGFAVSDMVVDPVRNASVLVGSGGGIALILHEQNQTLQLQNLQSDLTSVMNHDGSIYATGTLNGELFRFEWSKFERGTWLQGSIGDDQLMIAIDTHGERLGSTLAIQSLKERLGFLVASRLLTTTRLSDANGQLANLKAHGFVPWTQLSAFERFMTVCAGDNRADSAVHSSCITASSTVLTKPDNSDVWTKIAEYAPPGILLLFLLSTLGGLYRYNLRLSAFNNTRADILELVAATRNPEKFSNLSDLISNFSSDTIEFGKGMLPSEQISALINKLPSRT